MSPRLDTGYPVMRRACLFVLSVVWVSACGAPAAQQSSTIQPTYDKKTGKLTELTFDSNGNGRVDTWTQMNGTKALRSRVDTNEDGRVDRWEDYDTNGNLVRVGFSRPDNGKPDAWAYAGADGKVQRIEISSTGDERRIDRWEYYDATKSGAGGRGALVRAEEDTTGDGKPDKWESYEQGAIRTVAFDENGNGRPDRRLTYASTGRVIIESQPDESGRFAARMEVK